MRVKGARRRYHESAHELFCAAKGNPHPNLLPQGEGTGHSDILEAIEPRQLEGALKDREEALEWVKSEYLAGDAEKKRPTSNVELGEREATVF